MHRCNETDIDKYFTPPKGIIENDELEEYKSDLAGSICFDDPNLIKFQGLKGEKH